MAVLALQKHHTTKSKEKRQLIEENPIVSLIIGLKKTPNKTFRPHRMCVCLCSCSEVSLTPPSLPPPSSSLLPPHPSFLLPPACRLIPHTLYPPDETEVCLFVRTDKKTAKELLEKKKVKGITKVSSSRL